MSYLDLCSVQYDGFLDSGSGIDGDTCTHVHVGTKLQGQGEREREREGKKREGKKRERERKKEEGVFNRSYSKNITLYAYVCNVPGPNVIYTTQQ